MVLFFLRVILFIPFLVAALLLPSVVLPSKFWGGLLVPYLLAGLRLGVMVRMACLLGKAVFRFRTLRPFGLNQLRRFFLALLLLNLLTPWLETLFTGAPHLLSGLRLLLGSHVLQLLNFRFWAETLSFTPRGWTAGLRLGLALLLNLLLLGPGLATLARILAPYPQWTGPALLTLMLLGVPLVRLLRPGDPSPKAGPSMDGLALWLFLALQLQGSLEQAHRIPHLGALLGGHPDSGLALLEAGSAPDHLAACLRLLLGGLLLGGLWFRFREWYRNPFRPGYPYHSLRALSLLLLLLTLGEAGSVLNLLTLYLWLLLGGLLLGSGWVRFQNPFGGPFRLGRCAPRLVLALALVCGNLGPALALGDWALGTPDYPLLALLQLTLGGGLLWSLGSKFPVEPLTFATFFRNGSFSCGLVLALWLVFGILGPALVLKGWAGVGYYLGRSLWLALVGQALWVLGSWCAVGPYTWASFRGQPLEALVRLLVLNGVVPTFPEGAETLPGVPPTPTAVAVTSPPTPVTPLLWCNFSLVPSSLPPFSELHCCCWGVPNWGRGGPQP